MNNLRIGQGFDVHRLVVGRDLTVGGTKIPFDKGLEGHSDADVLLHAIMDALLGAAGLPDIGQHFPPDDEKYRDADSSQLLHEVIKIVKNKGFRILNIDATIMAEKPEVNPFIPDMKKKIGAVLNIAPSQINIKATTTERLGFVGRGEGLAALAVCLITKDG